MTLGTLKSPLKMLARRSLAALTLLCLAASAASSLAVHPHSLAYFNELAGGPENGHRHMLGSSLDWGQDLLFLRNWSKLTGINQDQIYFACYCSYSPEVIGLGLRLPPAPEDSRCWKPSPESYVAVSSTIKAGCSWYACGRGNGRRSIQWTDFSSKGLATHANPTWSISIYRVLGQQTPDDCRERAAIE